jgi:hypothetical protein
VLWKGGGRIHQLSKFINSIPLPTGEVNVNNSILRYGPRETAANYSHHDFVPVFLDEVNATQKAQAESFCGVSNRACMYDYIVSGSATFALGTKNTRQEALVENTVVSEYGF